MNAMQREGVLELAGDDENFEGFAYIDISNPMAAWNVVRGTFFSPSCLPKRDERAGAVNFAMAGLLANSTVNRISSELQLEHLRATRFPNTVSRLSGIFLFDDVESVARIWEEDPWGAHFNDTNLTDVGVSVDRSTRADAQWISMLMDAEHRLVQDWYQMGESYWSGQPANEAPIWERLVEGRVTIWGKDLRERALQEIRRFWPDSLQLLSYGANAGSLGSCDGATIPFVTRRGCWLELKYYLRMVDAKSSEFCEQLGNFMNSDNPSVVRYSGNVDLVLPDFSMYGVRRRLENGTLIWPNAKGIFQAQGSRTHRLE